MNSVQGLDELWRQELEQVDARMKESLRTKAQLSDRDIDNCHRSFVQDLLRRQSADISRCTLLRDFTPLHEFWVARQPSG